MRWRNKIVCPICGKYDFPDDWERLSDVMLMVCKECINNGATKTCKKCKSYYQRECSCTPPKDPITGKLVVRHHQHSQAREPLYLSGKNEILLGIELELILVPDPEGDLSKAFEEFPGVEKVWDGTINNRSGIEYTFAPMSIDWIKSNYDKFKFLDLIHEEMPKCIFDQTVSTHINVSRMMFTDEQIANMIYNFYKNPAENLTGGGGKSLYNIARWAKFPPECNEITFDDALFIARYKKQGKGRRFALNLYRDIVESKYAALHLKQFVLEYRALAPVVCFADFKKRIEYVENQILSAI